MNMKLPETKKIISIISGGLDSSIMTIMLAKHYGPENVYPISFDYNQKQKLELTHATRLTQILGTAPHKILGLPVLAEIARPMSANIVGCSIPMPNIKQVLGDPQPVTYVPFRNMIMMTLSLAYAESLNIECIFTGLQVHDEYGYWDTTRRFVDGMNAVADLNRSHKIKIFAPFLDLSKEEELKICMTLNSVSLLEHTLTCYNPNNRGESCGECPSCSERINAFMKNNIKDPIPYQTEIPWSL